MHIYIFSVQNTEPQALSTENPENKQASSLPVVCKYPSALEVSRTDYTETQYNLGTLRLKNLGPSQTQR